MAPVKAGDEGAERHGLNRDYVAGTFEEVKERLLGDPDFWREWKARHLGAAGVPDRPATDEGDGWGGPPTPGFITRGDHFPEVTVVYTRVTVTIKATFDIRDRSKVATIEEAVDRAVKGFREWGGVTVLYESGQVED